MSSLQKENNGKQPKKGLSKSLKDIPIHFKKKKTTCYQCGEKVDRIIVQESTKGDICSRDCEISFIPTMKI